MFPFSHATLELIEKLSFNVNFQLRDRAMHKTEKKERDKTKELFRLNRLVFLGC